MASPDWRTGEGFEWTRTCGLTALAWEFLRYNPDYREFVRTEGRQGPEPPGLARWGLRFRRGAGSGLATHTGVLARRGRRRCRLLSPQQPIAKIGNHGPGPYQLSNIQQRS